MTKNFDSGIKNLKLKGAKASIEQKKVVDLALKLSERGVDVKDL